MTQPTIHDVIISGGGMVGMATACYLARAGMRVAVVEKDALGAQLLPEFDGRTCAISLGSSRILDEAGVWAGIAAHAEAINDIRVSDGHAPIFLHYDHREVSDEPFGYIVENRHIRAAMQAAAAQEPNISLLEKTSITRVQTEAEKVTVHLDNGQILEAALLIGAEGRNSPVRDMASISVTTLDYKQTAIVCTIEHTLPHHGLAQERFLPVGPFAVLPMSPLRAGSAEGRSSEALAQEDRNAERFGGLTHRSSLVWVEPPERVQMYMELPEEEFVQEIAERVGDYLGEIKTVGGRFAYPLSMQYAKSFTAQRIALLGDAAHGMHPIAGQGVNLGFRDIGEFCKLATEVFAAGGDIGSPELLARYARSRRLDTISLLTATDVLTRLFSNNIIPLQLARDLGLWAVGKLPPLKRFFMRSAMGI
ncbi:MAG: FAD-dependent oxidoreductase [Alphaproteobacteria bacterium]|nr:FAD-dependent oxidoreductase [Alphaproteobacteria bacterium]